MTFEIIDATDLTSASLRELEQTAPNVTPKAIRAALVEAAAKLEMHERIADDCAKVLEEAERLRISEMASHSQATEVDRQVKRAIREAIAKLRGRPA